MLMMFLELEGSISGCWSEFDCLDNSNRPTKVSVVLMLFELCAAYSLSVDMGGFFHKQVVACFSTVYCYPRVLLIF